VKKSLIKSALFGFSLVFFGSCATHSAFTGNLKSTQTSVVLSQSNYRVINHVDGQAKATYVFGIGGLSKTSLIEQARSEMYSKADLQGGSRAIVNETFSTKTSFFLFFWKKQINSSADIIEFK